MLQVCVRSWVAIVRHMSYWPEALKKHEQNLALAGAAAEEVLKQAVEASLIMSKVTKVTAVLLHHFSQCTDLGKLRSLVQAEIRDLCTASVKEKDALHPILHKRVLNALALRV